ncbi:MAG: peptidyl-prolyl cis-trans isomerase [Ignavibacteriae bacterium]|nr:MAG: peptidyl-prolyl cis-trans isomerase [Ignavibacteriota bacterium]
MKASFKFISPVYPGMFWVLILIIAFTMPASSASDKNRTVNDTLALIGDKIITANQFKELFREKLISIGLTDNGTARMGYLSNLVDDELLIKQAKRQNLDRTTEAVKKKKTIGIQELLDAYSQKHFARKSEVTENDVRGLFIKMNKKIKVGHIYAKTKIAADSLYKELTFGAGFDDIARKTFTDPTLKERSGSLGYVSIDEMDPEFERAAYQMRVGEISKPVKTVQGYSIIRVEDIKGNPFVTESEFLKVRERLTGFAKRRKYEETVKEFTSALRSQLHIRCNTELLRKYYEASRSNSPGTGVESNAFVLSPREMQKTAVTWTQGKWKMHELISAMAQTSEQQKAWIHTEENLEDFIAGLILQRHVILEAVKEKLNTAPSYQQSVNDAFDTYLLATLEKQLKSTLNISADSLHSYYMNHKQDFMVPEELRFSAILLDNAAMSDSITLLLGQGVPFPDLAKRYSLQSVTAERGGDLGFYRRNELGDLGDQLFSLRPGDWLGPMVEREKHLFVKCTERKAAVQRSYEDSKKEIEDALVSMAWIDSRHRYADSLKIHIGCRIFPEKLQTITIH